MIEKVTVELTKDEVALILKYLNVDICAYYGCIDVEAEGCETCKITTITNTIFEKLKSAECKME